MTDAPSEYPVKPGDEPMLAALGEDLRPKVSFLRELFHKYDVGDATDCPWCADARFSNPEGEK